MDLTYYEHRLASDRDGEDVGLRARLKIGYRWLIIVLGIGSLMLVGGVQGPEPLLLLTFYSLLASGMEASRIQLDCGSLSLSSAVILATVVSLGIPAALITGAASYVVGDLMRRQVSGISVFNAGQAVLAILVSSYVYQRAGGIVGGNNLAFAWPQLVFLITYYITNHFLVSIALLLESGTVLWQEYRALAGWDLLATALAWPIGSFLSQIYIYLGMEAVAIAAIPLLILNFVWYLYIKVRRAHTEITKLYQAGRKIGTSIDLNTTLDLSLEQAQQLALYDQGVVYLVDGQTLMPVAHQGTVPDSIRYSEVKIGQRLVGVAAQNRSTEVALPHKSVPGLQHEAGAYELALPLTAGERLIGALWLTRYQLPFGDHEIQLLSIVAGQVATALENARLYSEVAALARLDGLTGLLNRRTLLENLTGEMARSRRYGLRLCVLMVDLDHFKKVNDICGHIAGDTLLRKIATSIQAQVRSVDIVGRYGGDEILVVLPETGPMEAYSAGERICAAVRCLTATEEITVTASIGIAGYPQHGDKTEQLLLAADQAMYQAKDSGGDRVISYAQLSRVNKSTHNNTDRRD